jgi:putative Mg2+ transporter-C (MgtC) family protein
LNFTTFDYYLILRMLVAAILGGIIGLERSGSNHEAGLRTHIVLCLGSAVVMIISEAIIQKYSIESEIMRMSAQVISGVGFLGAGSIIVNGGRIKGITTAAGLWTTACIGLAAGAGFYIIAVVAAVLMLLSMWGLRILMRKLKRSDEQSDSSFDFTDEKNTEIPQDIINENTLLKFVNFNSEDNIIELRIISAKKE